MRRRLPWRWIYGPLGGLECGKTAFLNEGPRLVRAEWKEWRQGCKSLLVAVRGMYVYVCMRVCMCMYVEAGCEETIRLSSLKHQENLATAMK